MDANQAPQIGLSDSELELSTLPLASPDSRLSRFVVPLLRPPSYSDSFLILQTSQQKPQPAPLSVPISAIRPRFDFAWWYEKIVSLFIHISLIALFETVFFFHFISKSEDSGLLKTVDGYVDDIADSCAAWPANVTVAVRDVLQMFVSPQNVSLAASVAAAGRNHYNSQLQMQAWLYFAGLTSLTAVMSAVALLRKMKFHWRRVILENIAMVALLGIYEFIFFRTIIYNYVSLSMPEIDEHIVVILRGMCGLF
jgi:hypothetical protein